MQIIYFQFKEFYVPFMTLQSIGFNFCAKIMEGSCVFVVQVGLVLTLEATLMDRQERASPNHNHSDDGNIFINQLYSYRPITNPKSQNSLDIPQFSAFCP